MANNKVVLSNGTVIVDMTDATITEDKILTGYAGYGANGLLIPGIAIEATARVNDEILSITGGLISRGD